MKGLWSYFVFLLKSLLSKSFTPVIILPYPDENMK